MPAHREQFTLDLQARLDYQMRLKDWLGSNETLDTIDNVSAPAEIQVGQDSALSTITNSAINGSQLSFDGETDPAGTVITIWADADENNARPQKVYRVIIDFTTDQGRQEQVYFDFKVVE